MREILHHNVVNPGSVIINLKGFMVGNPWTSPVHDNYGTVLFWFVRLGLLVQAVVCVVVSNTLPLVPLTAIVQGFQVHRQSGNLPFSQLNMQL